MVLSAQTLSAIDILTLSLAGIIGGFFLLVKGGDWTIDSAVDVAERLGVSPLLIGFTVIAFGTSLPELIVSLNANLKGFPGMALGNVIGSNIANILLVIGGVSLVSPLVFKKDKETKRDLMVLLLSTIALVWCLQGQMVSSIQGGAMVLFLVGYVFWQYKESIKNKREPVLEDEGMAFSSMGMALLFLIVGLFTIALGAELLVRSSVVGAQTLGLSDLVIGLTIIAFGTSLPELVVSLIGVKKGQTDIVIGNIVGSCVFNILSIVGLTALAAPIMLDGLPAKLIDVDVWVLSAITLGFIFFLLAFKRFTRLEGTFMVICYLIFNFEQYFSALAN